MQKKKLLTENTKGKQQNGAERSLDGSPSVLVDRTCSSIEMSRRTGVDKICGFVPEKQKNPF